MPIYKNLSDKNLIKGIKDGQIGVIPTDTIYGLVASALDERVVEELYVIKGRRPEKPFIILISDVRDLEKFNITLTPKLQKLLPDYWPGPNSLILPSLGKKFNYLDRGTASLAFRLPLDVELRKFLAQTGPLVTPSANPEGKAPAQDIAEATHYFSDKVDFYVDSGKITGQSSSLYNLTGDAPTKLR